MKRIQLSLLFLLLSAVISAQPDLAKGLVAYYPFNNNTLDESGWQNHGRSQQILFVKDISGKPTSAAAFNGKDSYIEIPPSVSLNSTKLLTITVKFYTEGPIDSWFLLQRGKKDGITRGKDMYNIRFSPLTVKNEIEFNVWEPESCKQKIHLGTVTGSPRLIQTYQWHCLVAVFDGNAVQLFVDGILSETLYPKQPFMEMCTGDFPIFIGAPVSNYFTSYKGFIDEVRIYNRVLTREEMDIYSSDCGSPSPKVIADFDTSRNACLPSAFQFFSRNQVRGTSIQHFNWDFGDGEQSQLENPFHQYKDTGTYMVKLTIVDTSGNIYEKPMEIIVKQLYRKFANAGKDFITCSKEPVQLNATGGIQYSWSPCIGLSDCNSAQPLITPGINIQYILTVLDSGGCADTDTINIKYSSQPLNFFLPNAFSPDDNGINDLFKPLFNGTNVPESVKWSIYNRYGQMIFTPAHSNAAWDGKWFGKEQPAGNYLIVFSLPPTHGCPGRIIKSLLTLIR